jgi:hypothetical protein
VTMQIEDAAVYFFSVLGLVAFGFIPARAWGTFKLLRALPPSRTYRHFLLAGGAVLVVSITLFGVEIGSRLFKCLGGDYCGPSVSSGLIYSAMFGASYLAFECGNFLLRRAAR